MELLNTKAAQWIGALLAVGILAIGMMVWLRFGGYLSGLVVVEVTVLVLLLNLAITVAILRWHRAPIVVYDKQERMARMVDGAVLEPPLFPNLTAYHGPINRMMQPPALLPSIDASPALPRAEPFSRIVRELRPDRLILGYNSSGPIVGSLDDLLSTAIVGRPGTGKTTALRFILASVLAIGGGALLMDPHGALVDDVSYLLAVAEDAAGMHRLAYRLDQALDRRLALRRAGQAVGPIVLAMADEWPIVSQLSPAAVEAVGRIILEGRKVGMYALIGAQGLPSDQLGGSYIRDALSSRYIFNVTGLQARMAGLEMSNENKALLSQLATAGAGYAILASAKRDAELVAIPDTSVEDLRTLLGYLPPLPPNPKHASLSLQNEPEISQKTSQDEEREKIVAAIAAHPDWSATRIAQSLGFGNNNKISLVKAIREEAQA